MEVAAMGVSYDWERNSLNKNGYIPLGSIPRMHRNSQHPTIPTEYLF